MSHGIDHQLFSAHEHALDKPQVCPQCGAKLVIRSGRRGPFLRCSDYPRCDHSAELDTHEHIEAQPIPGSACPECQAELVVRRGRYGLFIGCSGFPQCHWHQSPQAADKTEISCPQCARGELVERTSRYGKHFYSCNRYPKCRYSVNAPPVAQPCPDCGWPLLTEKKSAAGRRLCCPQKNCGYRGEPL